MESLNVNEIEQIVRDKRSLREMFATRFQEWYPVDKAFHTGFALLVLTGKKKLLKLTEKGAPQIPKVKYCPELDKENLYSLVNQHESLLKYIPDNSKPGYISLEFYHSLFYHQKRDVYDYLYSVFVTKKKQNCESIKKTFQLQIPSDISQRILSYKSNFIVPKSKPFFQLYRYRNLFMDQNNENQFNMSINNRNRMNIQGNSSDINMNHNLINSNHSQNSNSVNVNLNNIIRDQNYEFDSLLKSLFDYMIDENYNNITMLIQSNDDRVRYLEKTIVKMKQFNNYDSFKLRNTDDQVQMVFDCVSRIYESEYEQ